MNKMRKSEVLFSLDSSHSGSWEAQGDLEEPLEEALEEDVGSLEGDFKSDFVHDLKVDLYVDVQMNIYVAFMAISFFLAAQLNLQNQCISNLNNHIVIHLFFPERRHSIQIFF